MSDTQLRLQEAPSGQEGGRGRLLTARRVGCGGTRDSPQERGPRRILGPPGATQSSVSPGPQAFVFWTQKGTANLTTQQRTRYFLTKLLIPSSRRSETGNLLERGELHWSVFQHIPEGRL